MSMESLPTKKKGVIQDLESILKTLHRPVSIKGMEGENVPDPVAQRLLEYPESLRKISHILVEWGIVSVSPLEGGYGTSSVVLDAGGSVVRISMSAPTQKPDIPQVLQPIAEAKIDGLFIVRIPKLITTGITEEDVEEIKLKIDALGYCWDDAGTDNIGRDAEGNLKIFDGSVVKK